MLPNLWGKLCAWFGRDPERMKPLRATLVGPTQALAQTSEALALLARENPPISAIAHRWRSAPFWTHYEPASSYKSWNCTD
jgi:hypothetical protein